jgi:hypothetical protein
MGTARGGSLARRLLLEQLESALRTYKNIATLPAKRIGQAILMTSAKSPLRLAVRVPWETVSLQLVGSVQANEGLLLHA